MFKYSTIIFIPLCVLPYIYTEKCPIDWVSSAKALPKFPQHFYCYINRIISDRYRQQKHLISLLRARQQQISQWFSVKSITACDAIHFGTGLRFIGFVRHCRWVLGESFETEMQIISVGTDDVQYACAQRGRRWVLSVPSLLHWAESNLPFFEYLLWECCWSRPTYMERWAHLWLAAAKHQLRLKSSS